MFRRRATGTAEAPGPDQGDPGQDGPDQAEEPDQDGRVQAPRRSAVTAPKGAPTPKRSEAQASRRQPYQAPADRKAAGKQSRDRDRADRARRFEAQQRGEQWALQAKDKGPVRALARDVVDARRSIGEYYMYLAVLLIVLLFLPGQVTKYIGEAVIIAGLAVMIVDSWLVGNRIKRLAAERFPGESTRGVVRYVMSRSLAMRRIRLPKPRVQPGDKI